MLGYRRIKSTYLFGNSMKEISKTRKSKMCTFNNQMVELIDKADLTPPEAISVIRQIANRLEIVFEGSLKGEA